MIVTGQEDVRLLKAPKDLWLEAQTILRRQLNTPSYNSWVKLLQLVEATNTEAVLSAKTDWTRTMAMNQVVLLERALSTVIGSDVSIKIVVDPNLQIDSYVPTIGSITIAEEPRPYDANGTNAVPGMYQGALPTRPLEPRQVSLSNLNPKHNFDSFVVGTNNSFSHSAAHAVARSPGHAYNPLFVYGGVGLGKTHIMHAIGHEILRHSPHLNVRYLSCEKFTNELINSIRDDRMSDFRKRYRQMDVLLVDDIQFIEGKERTQEEFFHTFNALRDANRQIVLSSDRPPKAIAHLEERLRSRFEWGLISDIQAPDLETRMAILQKKCQLENMRLSSDVLEYIATMFKTNIRELEGALIRANAYANLAGIPLTINTLSEILQPGRDKAPAKPVVTIDQLIQTVGAHYRVEGAELRSSKRSQDLALPRHVAMYLAHEMMQMSFPRVGDSFGNRKHTSALYAHKRIKELLNTDIELAENVRQIRRQLGL